MDELVEQLKKDLAENYHESDDEVIKNTVEHYTFIASHASNRSIEDEMLKPYIYNSVKEAFLRRGDEGKTSSNEGGLNSSYTDIEEKLRKDVRCIRKSNF